MINQEQFQKEKMYLSTMRIAKKFLEEELISREEYAEIDTKFREKYKPSLGIIFTDINLII